MDNINRNKSTQARQTIALFLFSLLAASFSSQAVEFDFKAETKLNYRKSEHIQFPTNFPPDSFHETVDEGSHFELSNIALLFNLDFSDKFSLHTKIDVFDLYEKNPSSSDFDVSLDRFILRYGEKSLFPSFDGSVNWYAQIGKFGKFERQEDRHLESYGLVSTAFNRVEDSGIEFGLDFSNGLYGILSYTSGNPVFFRDPNALAGDNGVRKDPDYEPGLLVLYDAEIEEFDLSDTPETGIAAGYRYTNSDLDLGINVMLFHYQRDLADTKELHGTFYGGDLDFFEFSELFTPGPIDPNNDNASIPLSDNEKSESGLNLWWYQSQFILFAQYVEQTVGGLERDGAELELSYAFTTPSLSWLDSFQPVVRYSTLNNDFSTPPNNPSPSIAWDWTKLDLGFNLNFSPKLIANFEYAINDFVVRGEDESASELLFTLTWRYD